MPIPSDRDIRGPLLLELSLAGGSAKPAELYDRIAAHFPDMTPEEREEEMACGHVRFNNRVQWVRQRLVE
jgi:hypothetical protein